MRAFKTLFVALSADFASHSLAARQNLKVEAASSVANVMDKITGLLQAHGGNTEVLASLKLFAVERITPGATDSLNEILHKVISEIEQNVESKIKSGHVNTQYAIDERIADLRSGTSQAVDRKVEADDADNAWFNCVRNEKAALVAVEEAERALAQSRSEVNEPCQLQEDRSAFSFKVDKDKLKFYCDIAEYGNCDEQLKNYKSQITNMRSALQYDMNVKEQSYKRAKQRCDAAKADLVEKQSARDGASAEWSSQRRQCLEKHEPRQVAMCIFGTTLQAKCDKVAAYKMLMSQIDQEKGGEFSHPDRVAEWRTTSLTKCLLSKVVDGYEIDNAALDACEKAIDFAEEVGELDRQTATFEKLTTDAMFTCEEKDIKFRGQTWEVPGDYQPQSSQYVVKDFFAEVSLATGTSPFSFCGN